MVVTLTHRGADDHVTVKVSLPEDPKKWSGRLQATGGSAYLAGNLNGPELVNAVKEGYVATTTDAASARTLSTRPGASRPTAPPTSLCSPTSHPAPPTK